MVLRLAPKKTLVISAQIPPYLKFGQIGITEENSRGIMGQGHKQSGVC